MAGGADDNHTPISDGHHSRHSARVIRHTCNRSPRITIDFPCHDVPVADHVHPCPRLSISGRGAARPRAQALLDHALLHGPPRPRDGVERLCGAHEPALPRRRVPAEHHEPGAADADAPRLVPLPRHLRHRDPRVGLRVVGRRRPQRVLLRVVPARNEHPPRLTGRRAREERPARRRHLRAAPPCPGQKVVHVDRGRRGPRLRVPPAQHHQLPSRALADHGQLAEQREPPAGERRRRRHRGPRAGGHVVEHEAVGGRCCGGGVLVGRAGGGERRRGLRQHEQRPRPAEAVVERRLHLRLPLPRHAACRGELVEPHAYQALSSQIVRQTRDQVVHG
ncbi:hypothetical protein PR202_gb06571 [Eleusine coracana subsp. coracana]|uniref:Uncharacterized protein n=1 Tax=Eleusine coracana subsp. coracana TaxID=191504 RepID=A0AAV5E9Y2_ELECO|nr:hypothetical protein PR202_gb06571 [Eleusine coracana subsp. coracana]